MLANRKQEFALGMGSMYVFLNLIKSSPPARQWLVSNPLASHWYRIKEKWPITDHNGPLARYVILRVAHAPGVPGAFSPPPRFKDPDMHHGTCVAHVPWCMSGSLTSSFLWSRPRGKRSRHSRRMLNLQFYVSGKSPMVTWEMSSIPSHVIP